MKKFLSLVLSLVMAMSLVTVSAGAKDDTKGFTDASDINYKEAVDVMSRVGIISGYRDGSFRADGALTRGAAAKIIAYLNLGTKTADVLSCTSAPYKDVKPTDTFAPYIAYVKNAKIADGYSDNTFRAGAPLTGFAFNKMLLTSLGYDSKTEEFTGANWSVAVAKLAVKIGLTDGNDDFTGIDTCTREEACLYALNTLQATEVEYDNKGTSININGAEIVAGASAAEKVTTNDKDGKNIDDEKNGDNEYYLEFAEDHFDDLKLDDSDKDDFGAPANTWTYKGKDIGTYATEADFEFTTTADGDTVEDKIEDTGLDGYTLYHDSVTPVINGKKDTSKKLVVKKDDELGDDTSNDSAAKVFTKDLLGKGRLVKVYTDDQIIENIVVIDTYLAQIDSISSSADRVTLKTKELDGEHTYRVEDDDDCYAQLADMDEEDYVLFIQADKEVKSVAIPETVTGTISRISKNSDKLCDGLTFDGTKYKLSATADNDENGDAFTTKMELKADHDSTLYLDTYGYAIWIDDVEADSDYMVAIETYSSVEDGKIVTYVQGYDIEGKEVSLNIGTDEDAAVKGSTKGIEAGTVYKYSTKDAVHNGDYRLTTDSVRIQENVKDDLKASAVKYGSTNNEYYFDDDVKFLFIEAGDDMDDVTVETECQEVKIPKKNVPEKFIQYVLDEDKDNIIAIIIKTESDNATGDDVAYISEVTGTADVDGDDAAEYTLYIEGQEIEDVVSKDKDYDEHTFVTYAKNDDGTYDLDEYKVDEHNYDDTAVILGAIVKCVPTEKVMTLAEKSGDSDFDDEKDLKDLNCKDAVVVDLTDEDDIGNMSDLKDAFVNGAKKDSIVVSVVFNNKKDDDDEHKVSYIFVNDVDYKNAPSTPTAGHMKNVALTADGKVTVELTASATEAQAYTVELQQLNKNTGKYMTVNSNAGTVLISKKADEGSVNLAKGLMNVGDVYKVVCSNGDHEMESNIVTVIADALSSDSAIEVNNETVEIDSTDETTGVTVKATATNKGSVTAIENSNSEKFFAELNTKTGVITIKEASGKTLAAGDIATITVKGLAEDGETAATTAKINVAVKTYTVGTEVAFTAGSATENDDFAAVTYTAVGKTAVKDGAVDTQISFTAPADIGTATTLTVTADNATLGTTTKALTTSDNGSSITIDVSLTAIKGDVTLHVAASNT